MRYRFLTPYCLTFIASTRLPPRTGKMAEAPAVTALLVEKLCKRPTDKE
jgi:hypothetical protein